MCGLRYLSLVEFNSLVTWAMLFLFFRMIFIRLISALVGLPILEELIPLVAHHRLMVVIDTLYISDISRNVILLRNRRRSCFGGMFILRIHVGQWSYNTTLIV